MRSAAASSGTPNGPASRSATSSTWPGSRRTPMVAVGMNDEPLPRSHGYPARLIIPGLYGYVSATKWLSELELTRFDQFKAYWVPLGWAERAPVLTQSRIDV